MYCNCKQITSDRRAFDCAFDRKLGFRNAMLAGYTPNGFFMEALMLFMKLMVVFGLFPNLTAMVSVLPASVYSEAFGDKMVMHGYVLKLGLGRNRYVQNALMDLYSRIGKIDASKYIFQTMETKDIVSWNTTITDYLACGDHGKSLTPYHLKGFASQTILIVH